MARQVLSGSEAQPDKQVPRDTQSQVHVAVLARQAPSVTKAQSGQQVNPAKSFGVVQVQRALLDLLECKAQSAKRACEVIALQVTRAQVVPKVLPAQLGQSDWPVLAAPH